MARLFIAIELPARVKQALVKLQTEIPGAKWVSEDQLHLTLSFLGDVNDAASEQLCRKLSTIKLPAFHLDITTTGCFPDRRRPRVLWVGIKTNPRLLNLADAVRDSVIACGISQEERPFFPHITLARLKHPATREVTRFLDQQLSNELSKFAVREFILYQSKLNNAGALHIPLKTFSLGEGFTPF